MAFITIEENLANEVTYNICKKSVYYQKMFGLPDIELSRYEIKVKTVVKTFTPDSDFFKKKLSVKEVDTRKFGWKPGSTGTQFLI